MPRVPEVHFCMTSSTFVLVAVGMLFVQIAGCSGEGPDYETGQVSGTVTFDGKPVTEGSVTFHSEELGTGGTADLGSGGTFTVRGAEGAGLRVGSYVVRISPPPQDFGDGDPNKPAPTIAPKEFPNIPEKYRDSKTSGLKADVKAGPNEFKFEMTSK